MKKIIVLPAVLIMFALISGGFFKAYAQNQLWQTVVGNPQPAEIIEDVDSGDSSAGGGSGSMVSCPSNNYRQCLTEQFNVRIAGSPRASDIEDTYKGFRLISPYTAFYNAFKKGRITITYEASSICPSSLWCSGAWAYVESDGDMVLYRNIFSSSARYRNYFFIHEGAHVADNYLGRANDNLYYNAYTLKKDRGCFNSLGVIKTYASNLLGSSPTLQRRKNETFADAAYNAIYCKVNQSCPSNGGGGVAINNYPNSCKYMYNFMNNKLR